MNPGHTPLHRMFWSLNSTAMARVNWMQAPFDTQYATSRADAVSPDIEQVLTIDPLPREIMCGIVA